MNWLTKIFGGGAEKIVTSVTDGLDKLITNKEELAQVKLLVQHETNRAIEAMKASTLKEVELEIQDRSNARSREVEVLRAGGKNTTQNILAYMGIVAFFTMTGYIIARGLGDMNAEEAFIVGNLTGLAGAIAKDIYSYYFGSSIGSRNKDAALERHKL